MLHIVAQPEYLPTDMTDSSTMTGAAVFFAALVITCAWVAVGKYKRNKDVTEGRETDPLGQFKHVILPVILFVMVSLTIMCIGVVKEEELHRGQAENVAHNVLEAYEIDAIEGIGFAQGKGMRSPWYATIYKDGKAYEVEVAENPQTYEPTLLPKKGSSPIDLDALKKEKG